MSEIQLEFDEFEDILIASLKGSDRINSMLADEIKDEVLTRIALPRIHVILDLENIKFIDSSGFNFLLTIMKSINRNLGIFKICNISEEVMDLFRILQLHNVFDLYAEKESCIQSFKE